jgi:Ca-activated chloride channel family protein
MTDPEDEYFLIQFSDSPEVTQEFTTDISRLQSQLLFAKAKGRTSLYDALYLGMEKVSHGRNSRKALLVITDGEDNHSRYSLGNLKDFAKERDVMIYSIGIINPMDQQYGGFQGRGVLDNLANVTGGDAFFPDSVQALPAICSQIGLDLKTQYLLGYKSQNLTADGKWRKIRVKINTENRRASLKVRAKSGYYAPTTSRVVRGGDQ